MIIEEAQEYLDLKQQWLEHTDNTEWLSNAIEYGHRAEAIIELLEVHLCGSTGGFDKGQEEKDRGTLTKRLAWISRKHRSK
jgi:hypothetical protein